MSAPVTAQAQTFGSLFEEGIHEDDRAEVAAWLLRLSQAEETKAAREQRKALRHAAHS